MKKQIKVKKPKFEYKPNYPVYTLERTNGKYVTYFTINLIIHLDESRSVIIDVDYEKSEIKSFSLKFQRFQHESVLKRKEKIVSFFALQKVVEPLVDQLDIMMNDKTIEGYHTLKGEKMDTVFLSDSSSLTLSRNGNKDESMNWVLESIEEQKKSHHERLTNMEVDKYFLGDDVSVEYLRNHFNGSWNTFLYFFNDNLKLLLG